MTGRLKNESGFALILTLVVTALMVAVVVEMIHQVYVDTSLSRGFRDGQQASILAESGAIGGVKLLSSMNAVLPTLLAKPVKLEDEVGSLVIVFTDESGKININSLIRPDLVTPDNTSLSALQRLCGKLQLPESLWDAAVDWLDRDNAPYSSNGAETSYYRTLKPPYSARNNKLATVTELSLVKGFTPEIVGKLGPHLTVFPANAPTQQVNINYASKEVLQALDSSIDSRVADTIMEQRRLKAFENIGDVNARVPGTGPGLGNAMFCYKSDLFRITATARVKDSARTVEAVVKMPDGKFLSWQEY
jgi:general secretion pathway protein K